jgi:hypothetical protein
MIITKLSENQAESVWFVYDEQRGSWFDLVLLKSGERSPQGNPSLGVAKALLPRLVR